MELLLEKLNSFNDSSVDGYVASIIELKKQIRNLESLQGIDLKTIKNVIIRQFRITDEIASLIFMTFNSESFDSINFVPNIDFGKTLNKINKFLTLLQILMVINIENKSCQSPKLNIYKNTLKLHLDWFEKEEFVSLGNDLTFDRVKLDNDHIHGIMLLEIKDLQKTLLMNSFVYLTALNKIFQKSWLSQMLNIAKIKELYIVSNKMMDIDDYNNGMSIGKQMETGPLLNQPKKVVEIYLFLSQLLESEYCPIIKMLIEAQEPNESLFGKLKQIRYIASDCKHTNKLIGKEKFFVYKNSFNFLYKWNRTLVTKLITSLKSFGVQNINEKDYDISNKFLKQFKQVHARSIRNTKFCSMIWEQWKEIKEIASESKENQTTLEGNLDYNQSEPKANVFQNIVVLCRFILNRIYQEFGFDPLDGFERDFAKEEKKKEEVVVEEKEEKKEKKEEVEKKKEEKEEKKELGVETIKGEAKRGKKYTPGIRRKVIKKEFLEHNDIKLFEEFEELDYILNSCFSDRILGIMKKVVERYSKVCLKSKKTTIIFDISNLNILENTKDLMTLSWDFELRQAQVLSNSNYNPVSQKDRFIDTLNEVYQKLQRDPEKRIIIEKHESTGFTGSKAKLKALKKIQKSTKHLAEKKLKKLRQESSEEGTQLFSSQKLKGFL